MASNFTFLKNEWLEIFESARRAEKAARTDYATACFHARRTLETAVNWIYDHDADLTLPYGDSLNDKIQSEEFKKLTGAAFGKANYVRKIGNQAVHNTRQINERDALLAVSELFHFLYWLARTYTQSDVRQFDNLQFDPKIVPARQVSVSVNTYKKLKEIDERYKAEQEAELLQKQQLAAIPDIDAELQRLRKQITQAKHANQKYPDSHDYSEAETRKNIIDLLLAEAGWKIGKDCTFELEIKGMPNQQNVGFIDYVLWGDDGKPLAVVEAKRASVGAEAGKQQAKLYADCIEAEHQRRPVIFYTNGYEIYIWDDANYPPRQIQGFYTKDELELMIQRRTSRKKLFGDQTLQKPARSKGASSDALPPPNDNNNASNNTLTSHAFPDLNQKTSEDTLTSCVFPQGENALTAGAFPHLNEEIVNRHYQKRAIARVAENFQDNNARKSLIVMATGAGKTRTVIALCDLLLKANWAKRILFLADRVALVKQACNNFKKHLPQTNPVNLVTEKEQIGSRVYVSTYPTMMNQINQLENGKRRFGVGYFDLIVIDEAHRSVYQKYKAIFDYFDSYLVGLTATPKAEVDRNTYRLFDLQNGLPTDSYELDEAVKDGYLVPSVNISHATKFIREGIRYSDLSDAEKEQWEEIEWNEEGEIPDEIDSAALNQWLFNAPTIDAVIANLMENGVKIDGGDKLAKTIIFAKNHKHAVEIEKRFDTNYLHLKGEFARIIDNYATYTEKLIDDFSNPKRLPQIAISVDMLDTGIDIPEICNLVFFKTVRSKTKFLQMIGRGTRLAPNLFGEGKDKENFYIFDHCQNFEYFNQTIASAEPKNQGSLSSKIFGKRVELIDSIRKTPERDADLTNLDDELTEKLHLTVELINPENFVVRPHLEKVTKFKNKKAWAAIDPDSYVELVDIIAHLPNETIPEEETAKRFDFLILKTQLARLQQHKTLPKLKAQIIEIAELLEQQERIPIVKKEIALIEEIQKEDFWQDITLPMLETVRKRLRELVQHIERFRRADIFTDFEDEFGEAEIIEMQGTSTGVNLALYRRKVEEFLKTEENSLALQKLKRNKPITSADIGELERILFESGDFGTREDFEKAYGKQERLGLFIRSLVGLDRKEAKQAFNEFLDKQKYNANQIEFVNLIIDYLTKNGAMEASQLFESPYKNFHSMGILGIFPQEAAQILGILEEIKQNAAA